MDWGVLGNCSGATFYRMFLNCVALSQNIPDRIEVYEYSITGSEGLFAQMFDGCSHITDIPSLVIDVYSSNRPSAASNVAAAPFYRTFNGCTSLVDLSDKTLAIYDNSSSTAVYEFYQTFRLCTSIMQSPVIKIDVTHAHTFERMFDGASRVITDLHLDINNIYEDGTITNGSFYYMFINTGNQGSSNCAWRNGQTQTLHLYGDIDSASDFSASKNIFANSGTAGWSPYWSVVAEN